MRRFTISIDEDLSEALDEFLARTGYKTRSEGVRDLVRNAMAIEQAVKSPHPQSVANLSYVYNHRVRSLAERLSSIRHAHHDLVASTTLIHLDHDYSLESVMLKGSTEKVRDVARRLTREKGVRSAALNLIGVEPSDHHRNGETHRHSGKAHLSPVVA